jgi:hypothetical protein
MVDARLGEGPAGGGVGVVVHLPAPQGGRRGGPGWPEIDRGATVVVADTVLWRAGRAQLRALARALGRDQVLVFLEPTAEVGWRRLAHRLGRPVLDRLVGHRFGADVPAALRAAGLEVTELTRFGLGPGELLSYAIGRAEHIR